jgi:SRSO17 transposase
MAIASRSHSEQSLQKFVNQSSWDYEPMRQRVLGHLLARQRPVAWVLEEVIFPKHGRLSAAVDRQYVRSLRKVRNCQLAVTVTLTTDRFSVPVNWRLVVPPSWGRDDPRRARAKLPDHERPRPYWHYQIELIDDMALDWGMVPAPVVADLRQVSTAEALLAALEERDLPYLVEIGERMRLRYERPVPARVTGPAAPEPNSWQGPAGELVRRAIATSRTPVGRPADDTPRRSQFLQVPVRAAAADGDRAPGLDRSGQRRLVINWPPDEPEPRGLWVTNLDNYSLDDLLALANLRHRALPQIELLAERFGLRDYEGRTFIGWHHHVTLAAAAYAFYVLYLLDAGETVLADRPAHGGPPHSGHRGVGLGNDADPIVDCVALAHALSGS